MGASLVVVLLSFLALSLAVARLTIESPEPSPKVFADVVNIVHMIEHVRKVSVQYSEESDDVTDLIRGLEVPVTINAEEEVIPEEVVDTRTFSDVVLIVRSAVNVSTLLGMTYWSRSTYFMAIFPNASENADNDSLSATFDEFRHENALNVIAFVSGQEEGDDTQMFRFLPYPGGKDHCDHGMLYQIDPGAVNESLDRVTVTNLHGCRLKVSLVDLPPGVIFPNEQTRWGSFENWGTETAVVKEVGKKLNFTPWFSLAKDGYPWGWIHPSPSTGVVGEVYRKYSQFGVGQLIPTMERFLNLDLTVPVGPYVECITGAVPYGTAKKKPPWVEIYLSEYSSDMWIGIAVTFVLCTLSVWLLGKMYKLTYSPMTMFLYLFSTFLSVPIRVPRLGPLRWILLAWLWYSFVIILSYESVMRSKLTVPYRSPEIETILDLLNSNLEYTAPENMRRVMVDAGDKNYKRMADLVKRVTYSIEEALRKLLYERNIAYVNMLTPLKYHAINDPEAKGNIVFMKECVLNYYPIMLLQKNSPMTGATNKILRKLFESGIMEKWRTHYIYDIPQSNPPAIKLSLTHIISPLIALGGGLVTSILVFAYEMLSFYWEYLQVLCGRVLRGTPHSSIPSSRISLSQSQTTTFRLGPDTRGAQVQDLPASPETTPGVHVNDW